MSNMTHFLYNIKNIVAFLQAQFKLYCRSKKTNPGNYKSISGEALEVALLEKLKNRLF